MANYDDAHQLVHAAEYKFYLTKMVFTFHLQNSSNHRCISTSCFVAIFSLHFFMIVLEDIISEQSHILYCGCVVTMTNVPVKAFALLNVISCGS